MRREVLYHILAQFGVPVKLVWLIKALSDSFPIWNCLKQEYALSPLLFNLALE
jgi:hypothetical protein